MQKPWQIKNWRTAASWKEGPNLRARELSAKKKFKLAAKNIKIAAMLISSRASTSVRRCSRQRTRLLSKKSLQTK